MYLIACTPEIPLDRLHQVLETLGMAPSIHLCCNGTRKCPQQSSPSLHSPKNPRDRMHQVFESLGMAPSTPLCCNRNLKRPQQARRPCAPPDRLHQVFETLGMAPSQRHSEVPTAGFAVPALPGTACIKCWRRWAWPRAPPCAATALGSAHSRLRRPCTPRDRLHQVLETLGMAPSTPLCCNRNLKRPQQASPSLHSPEIPSIPLRCNGTQMRPQQSSPSLHSPGPPASRDGDAGHGPEHPPALPQFLKAPIVGLAVPALPRVPPVLLHQVLETLGMAAVPAIPV